MQLLFIGKRPRHANGLDHGCSDCIKMGDMVCSKLGHIGVYTDICWYMGQGVEKGKVGYLQLNWDSGHAYILVCWYTILLY